jgi:hypothetical protein
LLDLGAVHPGNRDSVDDGQRRAPALQLQ